MASRIATPSLTHACGVSSSRSRALAKSRALCRSRPISNATAARRASEIASNAGSRTLRKPLTDWSASTYASISRPRSWSRQPRAPAT